jgi:hypothetical protein
MMSDATLLETIGIEWCCSMQVKSFENTKINIVFIVTVRHTVTWMGEVVVERAPGRHLLDGRTQLLEERKDIVVSLLCGC